MRAYDEIYVARAQTVLGQMMRYATEDMKCGLNEFFDRFLISGVADLFGKGDYRFIVGMSGVEVAYEVMWRLTGSLPEEKPSFRMEKSPDYWTGWALAWYQWHTGQSFRRINKSVTPEEIREMYAPYHEMDLLQFADAVDARRRSRSMATRLSIYRERIGLSQAALARESNVSLRMIQHYEQRQKDLNRAQAQTLWNLSRALHCDMEDLMEG